MVSPNKTIEGALGGIAFAVVSMLVYALIIDLLPGNLRVNYGLALLYGFAGSLLGIFGDLCFSIVKRQTGIKDYGNLIPGHGGVLDRFDSLTLVAPAMEVLLVLLPMGGVRSGLWCSVSVFSGSTGSIGRQSLDIIRPSARHPGSGAHRRNQRGADGAAVPGVFTEARRHGNAGSRSGAGGTNKRSAYPGKLR